MTLTTVLKVRKLLNQPEALEPAYEAVALELGACPATLVYGIELAHEVLKHPQAEPFDLWDYYRQLAGLACADAPVLGGYFTHGPLLAHGEAHREIRRQSQPLYRQLESLLDTRIDDWTADFLARWVASAGGTASAQALCEAYAAEVFGRMLADVLACTPQDLPALPGRIFELLAREEKLRARESELRTLYGVLQARVTVLAQPPQQVWQLLGLVVMGHDALKLAILHALSAGAALPLGESVERCIRDAAPVSVLLRRFRAPVEIRGHRYAQGQLVFVSPSLAHRHADTCAPADRRSLAFGAGPHLCPGRRLALRVAQSFFDHLAGVPWHQALTRPAGWQRDLLLGIKDHEPA